MTTKGGSPASVPEALPEQPRSLHEVIESLWRRAETESADKGRSDHHVEMDQFTVLWHHDPVRPGFYNVEVFVDKMKKYKHCLAWRQGDITHFFYTYTDEPWHPSRPGLSK